MAAALAALVAFFLADPVGRGPALDKIAPNELAFASTDTPRAVPVEMAYDGTSCRTCHDGAAPLSGDPSGRGVVHDKVVVNHGRNRHCFNCHDRRQPATFTDIDGASVDLAKIELLCARCHGPTYRDWRNGAHGRRMGYWDAARGGPKPVVCIACHDPHWPVFKPLRAAPAPRVNPRTRGAAGAPAPGEDGEGERL